MTALYRTIQIAATPELHLVRVGALGLPRIDQADTLCRQSIARGFEYPLGTPATCDDCAATGALLTAQLDADDLAALFTARYEVVAEGTDRMSETLKRASVAHCTEPILVGERVNGRPVLDEPMRLDIAMRTLQGVRRHVDRQADAGREPIWRYDPEAGQGAYRESISVPMRARYLRPVPAVQS